MTAGTPQGVNGVDTHFAVVVEVGVEAHTVAPRGFQVDQRGGVGVVLGEVHVKLKAAVCIWGVCRTGNQDLHRNNANTHNKIHTSS